MGAWLSQKGVELDERDFFRDPFSQEELRGLMGNREIAAFFSWNSPSFKKLGLKRGDLDDDLLIRLMIDDPRLIRRPLIKVGQDLVVGTDKPAMSRLFPKLAPR